MVAGDRLALSRPRREEGGAVEENTGQRSNPRKGLTPRLTGALGLMTRLGACGCGPRVGVPGPLAVIWPLIPTAWGWGIKCADCGAGVCIICAPWWAAPTICPPFSLLAIKGLALGSFKETVEDAGVPWLELAGDPWAGELAAAADDDPESFFLEDLFESFARDNCSC